MLMGRSCGGVAAETANGEAGGVGHEVLDGDLLP